MNKEGRWDSWTLKEYRDNNFQATRICSLMFLVGRFCCSLELTTKYASKKKTCYYWTSVGSQTKIRIRHENKKMGDCMLFSFWVDEDREKE